MNTMKAAICTTYGPPEVLQLETIKKPTPKKGEVLVKIHATAVTASDVIVRGFKIPPWKPIGFMMGVVVGFGKPRNPVLGMVLSGTVEAVGQGVQNYKVGDEVFAITGTNFGCYAEYTCVPAQQKQPLFPWVRPGMMGPKPPSISHAEAAAIPYGVLLAAHYLRELNPQPGEHVLVYGASGAIGTTAVQLAKQHYQVEVTGVCSTRNLELVQPLGADHVLDYTAQDTLDDQTRYDIVLDAVGVRKSSKLKHAARDAVAEAGRYISVDDGTPEAVVDDLMVVHDLIEAGKFRPVIDQTFALEDIVEAHRYVGKGHKRGNVVVTISS